MSSGTSTARPEELRGQHASVHVAGVVAAFYFRPQSGSRFSAIVHDEDDEHIHVTAGEP